MSVAQAVRGCSSMVEPLPSKQIVRVRFSSPAPSSDSNSGRIGAFFGFQKHRRCFRLYGIAGTAETIAYSIHGLFSMTWLRNNTADNFLDKNQKRL